MCERTKLPHTMRTPRANMPPAAVGGPIVEQSAAEQYVARRALGTRHGHFDTDDRIRDDARGRDTHSRNGSNHKHNTTCICWFCHRDGHTTARKPTQRRLERRFFAIEAFVSRNWNSHWSVRMRSTHKCILCRLKLLGAQLCTSWSSGIWNNCRRNG